MPGTGAREVRISRKKVLKAERITRLPNDQTLLDCYHQTNDFCDGLTLFCMNTIVRLIL